MDLKKLAQLARTNPNAAKAFLNKKDSNVTPKKVEKNDKVFTQRQLDTIVRALVASEVSKIPKAKDGKTPTKEELKRIITPMISVLRQPKDGTVTQKHIDEITNRILKQVGKTPDLTEAIVNVFKAEKIKAEDLSGFRELKERVEKLANNQKYIGGRGVASGYTDSDVLRVLSANGYAPGGGSSIAYQATAPTDPEDGDLWIDTSEVLNAPVRSETISNIVALTQAEYDALGTPDTNTLYYIIA